MEFYSMAFVPCHVALVPLEKKKSGLAPKMMKFQPCTWHKPTSVTWPLLTSTGPVQHRAVKYKTYKNSTEQQRLRAKNQRWLCAKGPV